MTALTPGERVAMVWRLSLDSWATMREWRHRDDLQSPPKRGGGPKG